MSAEIQLNDPQTLYRRWEDSQWNPFAIDLDADCKQWAAMERADRDLLHWVLSSLMVAEERITTKFSGLVGAHGTEEEATFLSTQQVDEARHMQFYARFQDEVIASPATVAAHVERARREVSPAFERIFDGALVEAHERLIAEPASRGAKVRFITLYHLILEGTLGLTTFRFATGHLEREGMLPGFVDGYSRIHHDETRHIGYGVWFLREAVREHPDAAERRPRDAPRAAPLGRGGALAVLERRRTRPRAARRRARRDPRLRPRRPDPPPGHHRGAAQLDRGLS